jgi:hypothetical protein
MRDKRVKLVWSYSRVVTEVQMHSAIRLVHGDNLAPMAKGCLHSELFHFSCSHNGI